MYQNQEVWFCNLLLAFMQLSCLNIVMSIFVPFFFFPEIFSRVAVVCLILGIMILLAMVFVAFYRSSQSKQLMKGTSGTGQGMLNGSSFLVIVV